MLFDSLLLGNPRTPLSADLADALERQYILQSYSDISKKVAAYAGDKWTGDSDLQRENLKLDTAMKRRALGIPQDTEEFNEMENGHHPLHLLSSLGIALDKAVEYPKETHVLKSLGSSILGGSLRGKAYGRGISGGSRALRRAIGGFF